MGRDKEKVFGKGDMKELGQRHNCQSPQDGFLSKGNCNSARSSTYQVDTRQTHQRFTVQLIGL